MTEEQILEAWGRLRDRATMTATQMMNDPVWAGMNGYRLGAPKDGEVLMAKALELAAKRIVPAAFRWEVVAVIGDQAVLFLTGYDARDA